MVPIGGLVDNLWRNYVNGRDEYILPPQKEIMRFIAFAAYHEVIAIAAVTATTVGYIYLAEKFM